MKGKPMTRKEELQGLIESLTASLETMRPDEFGNKSFHQECTEAALRKAQKELAELEG